jgi:predicted RNA methylase
MANPWFATHAAGFGPLVARLMARDVPGFVPRRGDDSSVLFSADADPRAVLAYCRSLFRVRGDEPGGIEQAARAFARATARPSAPTAARTAHRGRGPETFVLRAFGPDDPASLPVEVRRALESAIAAVTGLRPDSGRPDREFRVQERADGRTLFLERWASAPDAAALRDGDRAGELPRSTCRLLAEMTEPRPDDVFLDPFCGYGGIALERALASPYRFVFASDSDADRLAAVRASLATKPFERRRRTIFPKVRDALDSGGFDSGFVTAIATDPPWGLFEGGMGADDAQTLLRSFLVDAARLLASGGRLVLLVARGAAVEAGSDFTLRERLDVLVSGKKTSAIRLDRV